MLLLCATSVKAQYTTTTLAGQAIPFGTTRGACLDASGNLYIADNTNYRILKYTPAGVMSVFAGGSATGGYVNGTGTAARFQYIAGLDIDASGNIYAAETNRIRKITSAGVVTNYCGTGATGYVEGNSTTAQFKTLSGICIDASGVLYVSDYADQRIRKISTSGTSTLFAGSGSPGYTNATGASAQFYNPAGLDVDGSGNVYVADQYNNRIRKITSTGVVTTLAGHGTGPNDGGKQDGVGATAGFLNPLDVEYDGSANLYIADWQGNSIRKIVISSATVSTIGGSGTTTTDRMDAGYVDGPAATSKFWSPISLVYNATALYVVDNQNNLLRTIISGTVATFAGTQPGHVNGAASVNKFTYPMGITTDATGNIYVADQGNNVIRKITSAGVASDFAGLVSVNGGYTDGTGTAAEFYGPSDMVYNKFDGNFYVVDQYSNLIRKITPAGVVTTYAGVYGSSDLWKDGDRTIATFNYPNGIDADQNGNLYIADAGNNVIRKITPAGIVSTIAGDHTALGDFADGTGSAALFNSPWAVTCDALGNVYVAEYNNYKIRKIVAATGVVTSIAGGASAGSADGTGTAASFSGIYDLAMDYEGNILAVDASTNNVRKITPAGVVTTILGSGLKESSNGVGTAAGFNSPGGITVTCNGTIYTTEYNGQVVRKITYPNSYTSPATPTISASGNTTVCAGGSVTLTSSSTSNNHWSNGATTQSITVSASGSFSVYTGVLPCTSATSSNTTVSVGTSTAPSIAAGTATTFCTGGSVTLTATGGSAAKVIGNYVWSTGSTGNTLIVSTSGTYSARTVNLASGCTSSTSNTITVTVSGGGSAPTVTTSGSTALCNGSTVTLTSSETTDNHWSNGATTQSITVSAAGSYTVYTGSGSCTSATSAATVVTAASAPSTPTISAGGSTSLCAGSSVTLTSSATSDNHWSNGATTQSITVSTAGSYTVYAGTGACTSGTSAATTVTVGTSTAPSINGPGVVSGSVNICSGSSVVLTAGGGSAAKAVIPYLWSNGTYGSTLSVTTAGTYTARYINTLTGCTSAVSNSITVTVTNTPSTPSVSPSGTSNLCSGSTLVLTSSSATGNLWSNGATTQSITVSTGATYSVQVISGTCTSATSNSAIVNIGVSQAPSITAPGVVSGSVNICSGSTLVISAGGGSAAKAVIPYLWSNGTYGATLSVTTAGTYSARYVNTLSGCTSGVSNTITVTVTNSPNTPAISTSGSTALCSGGSVTLTSSSATGNLWSTNATSQSITVSAAGSYTVKVISGTCTSAASNASTVTVGTSAAPSISAGGTTSICSGSSVTLTATGGSAAKTPVTNYLWSNGSTGSSISVNTAGTYTAQFISSNGACTSAASNAITVSIASAPSAAGTISGSATATQSTSESYSVSAISGATGYTWAYSGTGATLTPSGTTVSVSFAAGATSGNLSVYGSNTCGNGTSATKAITVSSATPDLYVPANQTISGGPYNNVTFAPGTTATLSGNLTVNGSIVVPDGVTLITGCNEILGDGSFTLMAGGYLQICSPSGIAQSGATGAVQTATRIFSDDANYIYNGSASQVTGSGLPAKARNITINNAAGVSLTNASSVTHVLELSNGNFNTNNHFTLLSDENATAMVVNTNGTSSGTAKAQRYITAAINSGTGYRHYSTPVAGQTLAGLSTTTGGFSPVLNTDYNTAAVPGLVTPFPNVFAFNEARITATTDTFSKGWYVPTGNMEAGRGYSVNIGANKTLQVSGTLNNGDQPVTYTGGHQVNSGWLLVGNPYPAPIDWSRMDLTNQFENAIYTAQSTGQYAGRYGSYVNGVANNGGSKYIGSMQGFFMRANMDCGGVVPFTNALRLTTYMNPSFYRSESRPGLVRLQLSAAGSVNDETVVYFEDGAFAGFDKDKDAGKVHAGGMSLYTMNENEHFSINCLPLDRLTSPETRVPLAYSAMAAETHTINVLESEGEWFVYDRADNLMHEMPYSFITAKGRFENRLQLVRTNNVNGIAKGMQQLSLFPNPTNSRLQLALPGQSHINMYDAAGRAVLQAEINDLGSIDLSSFPNGVYTLRCINKGQSSVHKVVKQ
ncbi:MAG: T9SS type A sorting domain-containing protein [Bacteroidota bacterium]